MKKSNYIYKNHDIVDGMVKVNVLINKGGALMNNAHLIESIPDMGKLIFDSIKIYELKVSKGNEITHTLRTDIKYATCKKKIEFSFEDIKCPLFISYQLEELDIENKQYDLKSELRSNDTILSDIITVGQKVEVDLVSLEIKKEPEGSYEDFTYKILSESGDVVKIIKLENDFTLKIDLEPGKYKIQELIKDEIGSIKVVTLVKGEDTKCLFKSYRQVGSIKVNCVCENTNEIVAGAHITIKDKNTGRTVAKKKGNCVFQELEFGEYIVINEKGAEDYFRDEIEHSVKIDAQNNEHTINFSLEKFDLSHENDFNDAVMSWTSDDSEEKNIEYIETETLGVMGSIVITKEGETDYSKYSYRIMGDNNVFEILFLEEDGVTNAIVPFGKYEIIEHNNSTNEKITQHILVESTQAKIYFGSEEPSAVINIVSINEKTNTVIEDINYVVTDLSSKKQCSSDESGVYSNLPFSSYNVKAILNEKVVAEKNVILSNDNSNSEVVFFITLNDTASKEFKEVPMTEQILNPQINEEMIFEKDTIDHEELEKEIQVHEQLEKEIANKPFSIENSNNGKLIIKKDAHNTNRQYEYEIRDESGNLVKECYLNQEDLEIDLKPGNYRVNELNNVVDSKIVTIKSGYSQKVIFEGAEKGSLKINKFDTDTNEMIKGALFEIQKIDTEETLNVSLEDTVSCTITEVPFGKYKISEVKSPPFYIREKKAQFVVISKENSFVEVNFYNSSIESKSSTVNFNDAKANKKESNEVSDLVSKMILEL